MSERLPYEEQLRDQLNELPLPDENQAWEKMSLLLDEDDEDRIVPPIFLRSCLGWGLLLLALGAFLWFYFRPHHEDQEKSMTAKTKQILSTDHPDSFHNKKDPATTSVHLPTPANNSGEKRNAKESTSQNELIPEPTALAPSTGNK